MNWNEEAEAEAAAADREDDLQWGRDYEVLVAHCRLALDAGEDPLHLATSLLQMLHAGPVGDAFHDDFVDAYYRWDLPIILRACATAVDLRRRPVALRPCAGAALVQ